MYQTKTRIFEFVDYFWATSHCQLTTCILMHSENTCNVILNLTQISVLKMLFKSLLYFCNLSESASCWENFRHLRFENVKPALSQAWDQIQVWLACKWPVIWICLQRWFRLPGIPVVLFFMEIWLEYDVSCDSSYLQLVLPEYIVHIFYNVLCSQTNLIIYLRMQLYWVKTTSTDLWKSKKSLSMFSVISWILEKKWRMNINPQMRAQCTQFLYELLLQHLFRCLD